MQKKIKARNITKRNHEKKFMNHLKTNTHILFKIFLNNLYPTPGIIFLYSYKYSYLLIPRKYYLVCKSP